MITIMTVTMGSRDHGNIKTDKRLTAIDTHSVPCRAPTVVYSILISS